MFVMHFWGLQYAVGDDPFHFGPWTVLGPWHAPVIFSDERDRWFITHALRPFGKPSTKRPYLEPLRGLYIGRTGVERRGACSGRFRRRSM